MQHYAKAVAAHHKKSLIKDDVRNPFKSDAVIET